MHDTAAPWAEASSLLARERRVLAALAGGAGKMVESTGSGYLPPHHASLVGMSADVRYAAGIDKGMIPVRG